MKNRYNEVMNKIEVTDEMRDRILNNISNIDLKKTTKKVVTFSKHKKYLSIAACFIILIVGSVIVHNVINLHGKPPVQVVPGVVSYKSVGELSDAIGFNAKEIQELPFDIKATTYTSYSGELAEIEYVGTKNTAIFRMAVSDKDEDISGNYDEFTSIERHLVNGYNVTIKGHGHQYTLAIWHEDGFSYALQFGKPVSKQEMLSTLQRIN